jgi:autotransporter passenger strand-loop-strand repeat protein
VLSGGTADATTVISGGFEQVDSGGTASGTIISNGGSETVLSGGTDLNTIVSGGGYEIVSSGGSIDGATIAGGTLELAAGVSGSGTISFATVATSETLKIDGTSMPGNPIAHFPGSPFAAIDLIGVSFDPSGSATLTSGGVLQIVENGHTYDLNFTDISYGLTYVLSADGSGGTDLTTSNTWIVVGAGHTSTGLVVSSGFSLDVGGTAIDTVLQRRSRVYRIRRHRQRYDYRHQCLRDRLLRRHRQRHYRAQRRRVQLPGRRRAERPADGEQRWHS